jgi:hypothetical protein
MKVKVTGSPERGVELVNASTGEAIKGVASISCSIEPGEIVRTRVEFIDCAWNVLPGIVPVCPPNTPNDAIVWAPIKSAQPDEGRITLRETTSILDATRRYEAVHADYTPAGTAYGEGVVLALLDNDSPAGTDTANKLEVDMAAPVKVDNSIGVEAFMTQEIVKRFGGG